MQVAEHVVSLYVATCGQNGPGLGSDEKEIILLVYVVLEAATGKIVGTKQILVRPDGSFVKDRTVSVSSDVSHASSQSTSANSPPLALTYAEASAVSNNNNGHALLSANNNTGSNSTISTSTSSASSNNHTNSNNISNSSGASNSSSLLGEGIELPRGVPDSAFKPLQEAIEEFDQYVRSLALGDTDELTIITDGQLPLRQCLHREACAKDIELPIYYNKFCDLRKALLKFKAGDLTRALVPVKDIKKMLQVPAITPPQCIADMMKELNIGSIEDADFYVRDSRDMVSVIQAMLAGGHKFIADETVSLVLEPGICSINDEIDGNCIVRARGLPWQSSDQDIAKFFRGLNVAKGGVALCLSPLGRRNGEALIRFVSQEHRDMALKRHKHHIGNRYIEVYRATGEDFLAIAGGASNEAQAFLSKGAQVIIRMRGLPYDCTAKQVLEFFTTGENPCHVLDAAEGVLFVKKPDGRATGDAFVLFANESDAPKALARHRESIGQRYIELFRSTTAEVQQVLNRSMDPKTYEPNHQPPLIAQLPTVPLSLLPQHLITSGTAKNCIRLRGLPYEALVEHILHFLDDFAKCICYQGVHMVINAQGQPSGEAFIQMETEESARLCAQRKHNQFMVFGKKYRYIEVFQCSGDDMNMVLNGGLHSPVSVSAVTGVAAHHPHHATAKQPSLLSPGASVIGAPFAHFAHYGPPQSILAAPHRLHHAHGHHQHHHHHHHHPGAGATAFFSPHPLVYWPYPSPPVSPTAYFSQPSAHSPPHVPANLSAAQHQHLYSVDFIPAVAPGSLGAPMSPPSIAIPPAPGPAGLILTPAKSQPLALLSPKQFSPLPTPITPLPAMPGPFAANNKALEPTPLPGQEPPGTATILTPTPETAPASAIEPSPSTVDETVPAIQVATDSNGESALPVATSQVAPPEPYHVASSGKEPMGNNSTMGSGKVVTSGGFGPNGISSPISVGVGMSVMSVMTPAANTVNGQGIMPNPCVELYIS